MVMAVSQFERLFREAASLDIDKNDIKRTTDFINRRLYDLLLLAQATARANGRDIIEAHDLPLTKGLQASLHAFKALNEKLALAPILEQLARLPTLDLDYSEELEQRLPELAGAITVSLARVFRAVYPKLKNPGSAEWQTIDEIYEVLL